MSFYGIGKSSIVFHPIFRTAFSVKHRPLPLPAHTHMFSINSKSCPCLWNGQLLKHTLGCTPWPVYVSQLSTFSNCKRSFWWTECTSKQGLKFRASRECADSINGQEFSRSSVWSTSGQRRVKPGKFSHIAPAHGWCDCHPLLPPRLKRPAKAEQNSCYEATESGTVWILFWLLCRENVS